MYDVLYLSDVGSQKEELTIDVEIVEHPGSSWEVIYKSRISQVYLSAKKA